MTPTPDAPASSSPRATNRLTLLLIAGSFVLPIIIAWLLASGRLGWQPASLTNHGTLLAPPIDVASLPKSDASEPLRTLPTADWALLYVSAEPCGTECRRVLDELAAMRMVIGKNGTRLNVFGVFSEPQQTGTVRQVVDPALVRAIGDRLDAQKLPLPFVGFLDWRGQLMMHFAPSAPPDDIKGDMKRLLTASAIK